MQSLLPFLFSSSSWLVMPFWLLMLLWPRAPLTARVIGSPWIVAGPLALYTALVLPRLAGLLPAVANPQLATIAGLLGTPAGATLSWVHFLALDLFAGRWIFLDARARGLGRWATTPVLLLTSMFAPLGLGVYLLETALAPRLPAITSGLGRLRRWLATTHQPLARITLASTALFAGSLLLALVDHRQVTGAPVWLKPAKFGISIALMAPVLAWILDQLPRDRRLHRAGTVISLVAGLELALITVQAIRGVPSHFNYASRLDGALFTSMGIAISGLWLGELFIAVRTFRHRFATPARTWGIRLGLVGALLGGAVGFVMPRPTPTQLASLRAGQPTPILGAHAVGVPDGGPGLPITRWSTVGGDLRVPHFFGLHALQILPLAAWLLERRRRGARTVVALGAGWIGLVVATFIQAERGQPLLAPDALTAGLPLIVLGVGLAIAWVVRTGSFRISMDRRSPRIAARGPRPS
jgi:hypothetical protein